MPDRILLLLIGCLAALPVLGGAALLWRRFYHDDETNAARRIFKNSAVPLVLRLLVRGLDLVVAVVLLRQLAPDALGAYNLAALFVVQYLGTLSEFGLGTLLTREAAKEPQAASRLFAATLALRLLLVAACIPAVGLLIGLYWGLAQAGLGAPLSSLEQQALWVLVLTLVPGAYSGAVTALCYARERMELPALIELFTALLSTVARIGVVLLGGGVLALAWAAVGVSSITALLFVGLQFRWLFAPGLLWDTLLLRQLLGSGLPLMLNGLLVAVFFRFDTFLIRAFGDALAVQRYTMPYQVLGIAMILPPIIVNAVFPLLSRRAGEERVRLAQAQQTTLRALLLLALPLAMALSVLAVPLVMLFTGDNAPDYLLGGSALVLAITAWFLPLSFVNGLNQYLLIAIDQQRAITLAFAIAAISNLGLNLLAIPLFGLVGASVVTILTEVVLYVVLLRALRRERLVPPLFILGWRPLVAALAMGLGLLPLLRLDMPLLILLLALPVGAASYGVMLWLLGAFGVEERALVRRVLGRV
jgi:O-antigen/teichoic acid export membrane protein